MDNDKVVHLRRRLTTLENQIRTNEQIWSGFRQIEVEMIGCQTLSQVLASLINGLLASFEHIDFVTISHIDQSFDLARLLRDEEGNEFRGFVPIEPGLVETLFVDSIEPKLGVFSDSIRCALFPDKHPNLIASMAVAPLVLHGTIVGSLNQASRDPDHFREGKATDLLQHLAAVTSMCIDNAVSHEKLKQDGLTDPLTGISNRRFFERRLAEETERARRSQKELACIVVDIDHFKKINDIYGHVTGDHVLQRVAAELGKDLRSSDVLARYGGEEFVLLLPTTTRPEALEIAERLRGALEHLDFRDLGFENLKVSGTLGLALSGKESEAQLAAGSLFERADSALYLGKNSGRNQVVLAE